METSVVLHEIVPGLSDLNVTNTIKEHYVLVWKELWPM